jgi:1,4-dihydroxy-2-naphthoate octaprenyltransferase
VGPVRLVAGELASVRDVKIAAAISFAIAGVAGLLLALAVSLWLIPLGLICVVAGWAYTGGPHPYGYLGFGELFVFVFFGLVATAGSAYVQHAPYVATYHGHSYNYAYNWWFVLWVGVPVGLLAAALLQANNLRDIETDTAAGKKTLAVRLGRQNGGLLYSITLMGVALSIGVLQHYRGWSLIALLAMPLAFYPVRIAMSERAGRRLLPMLGATARLQLIVGLLLAIGLLLVHPDIVNQ